ncbi:MAG TPA: N-acetylmuramoyl-L-alanine amidase [Bryobacteraceae bacterium]|nr:N-acetylmuramoyl-L-alanine amidase [Bryobacteraceae bacterium]
MSWRYVLWTVTVLGLPPALAASESGLIQVTNLRAWSHADSTRVIVETTGPFEYQSDRAQNPERLYIDILHSRPWIAQRRFATREIGDKLVRRVRVAETAPGVTRIVFDLVGPADFKISRLDTPDRMVIEVRPLGSPNAPATPARSSTPISYVSTPPEGRRLFVYPPTPRRPRVSMLLPGPPPAIASSGSARAFDFGSFNSPDVLATLFVPPPSAGQVYPSSTRVIPAAHPLVSSGREAVSSAHVSENASRSLTRALGLKVNRIVIDAGHGGHDYGTIGPNGVLEKDVVLDVALRLSKLVQERMGAEVVLTRSDDTFIPLHERTAIANDHKADLFLSIHANSSPAPEVAGTETFFLNFTNAPDALNVAARENAGSDKTVGELKDLIQTITLNDKIEESHTFAEDIQSAIQGQAARSNAAAHNRGVKRAPFVVLIGASMPSVLAEIGFLSNGRDESNLGKPAYRQKIAEALYKGLAQYSQSLSHFEPPRQLARTTVTKTTEKPAPSGLN